MKTNKEKIKIGIASLALLMGLTERGITTLADIINLKTSRTRTLGSVYKKLSELPNFFDYYEALKNLQENSLKTALWRLRKRALVEKKNSSYHLTKLGWQFIKKLQDKKPQKQWDGKWRIVMFDIPEKERAKRNWLRYQLLNLEFKTLQKSVFIGKWPLDEDLFKEIFKQKLHPYVRLTTVGEIDDDRILKEF